MDIAQMLSDLIRQMGPQPQQQQPPDYGVAPSVGGGAATLYNRNSPRYQESQAMSKDYGGWDRSQRTPAAEDDFAGRMMGVVARDDARFPGGMKRFQR